MSIQHEKTLKKTAVRVLKKWIPFNESLMTRHDEVSAKRNKFLVAHMFKIWRAKRRMQAVANRDTA